MRLKSILLLLFIVPVFFACKKDKGTCYDCEYVNAGGQTVYKKVCTEGDPQDELPDTDANGAIVWGCTKR